MALGSFRFCLGYDGPGMLFLHLYGKVELRTSDRRAINFPTKHAYALLAYLSAREGSSVLREDLAQSIWPESPGSAALASLRNALPGLRKVLGANALVSEGRHLKLAAGVLTLVHESGDFMPGFTQEWVLDRRLSEREAAIEGLLARAKSAENPSEALQLAKQAAALDPLSDSAARVQHDLLLANVGVASATIAMDAHRRRVMHDLGLATDSGTSPGVSQTQPHPIEVTCQYLLDRSPNKALDYLRATHSYWMANRTDVSLQTFDRVLSATSPGYSGRLVVECQRVALLWVSGQVGPHLAWAEKTLEQAIAHQELEVCHQLITILAYGYLSAGNFKMSVRRARDGVAMGERGSDLSAMSTSLLQLSIIHQHTGNLAAARVAWKRAANLVSRGGSPEDAAQVALMSALFHNLDGRLDLAQEENSKGQRYFEASGGKRMVLWTLMSRASTLEAAGEFEAAIRQAEWIADQGPELTGHSLLSASHDLLARVRVRMGDLESAAEELAESSLSRRQFGSTESVFERRQLRSAKATVRSRLSPREIEAAFLRVQRKRALLASTS
jgi:tetratricopeptide (TPR) repeat protein